MALHKSQRQVQATWLCRWYTLPDNDPATEFNILVPTFLFGESFHIVSDAVDEPLLDVNYPRLTRVTAVMSKALYTVMLRVQQGEDMAGVEPPLWSLVEGTASEVASGRVLEVGEVFGLLA